MKVHVHYMAQLRTAAGRSEEPVELPPASSVLDLLVYLAQQREGLATHLLTAEGHARASLLVAKNGSLVSASDATAIKLASGDTVTLLPPIAGG